MAKGPATPAQRWNKLFQPVRILVYLLIAAVVIQIYHQAEIIISKLFSVALLFVFGAIIAMLLTPLADRIEQRRPFTGHRGMAVLALNLTVVLVGTALMALLTPQVASQASSFARSAPHLAEQARAFMSVVQANLNARGIPLRVDLPSGVAAIESQALVSAFGIVTGTVATLVNLILIVVIAVYFQVQGAALLTALRQLFPGHQELIDFSLVATGATVAAYVRGQLIMALLMAGYTGLALTLLGVHYAIVIAVAAFFLEFLPLIGAPAAMALGVVFALFQSPLLALLAAVVGLGGHAIEAYIVGPRVTGHATRLHPLAAMAALIIGAELGGILGALFAVPLAGVANIYLGALYRSQRGEDAFSLPAEGTSLEDLPRLGDEVQERQESEEPAAKS